MEEVDSGDTDPYRELFERSADAILIIEGETFVDCNQAAVEMLRCTSKEEVLQTHPSQLSPPTQPDGRESFEKANEMIATAFDRGSHRFEWEHLRSDGEVFPVEVLLTAVRRGGKRILHVVWRDITERKRLEAEVRHSQKMLAVGQLAGGIAHDFNNLLVAIMGYSEMLAEDLRDPDARAAAEEIRLAARSAAALTRQLLTFSRKRPVVREVFDLRNLLTERRRLLERLIGENVRLELRVPEVPARVNADPGQIEQVLLNLAANARDAMPGGGSLTIAVSTERGRPDVWPHETENRGEAHVLLEVSDSGVGMDDATVRRAFEPFFTTKALGQGTGLGLATVYGIVEQSGGTATIASQRDHGTTVRVFLPQVQEQASPDVSPPEASLNAAGTETVLVVEDESAVLRLIQRTLERLGYRVLLARDGREALAIWEQSDPGSIDLVLTDVVMPNMGGLQLLENIRRRGGDPRVLVMSGYAQHAVETIDADERIGFVDKPFSAIELGRRVRTILDG